MRRQSPATVVGRLVSRAAPETASGPSLGRLGLAGALLLVAGVAWAVTGLRMAGMDNGPGSDPGALGFYLSTWVVMMAAMMFPSIVPVALAHRELHRRAAGGGQRLASTVFVLGYLGVWAAAGLVGYVVLEAGRSLDGGLLAWHGAGRWTAGAVLLFAAGYELTPLKRTYLTRCRTPRAALLEHWREGQGGGLRLGMRHGGACLGCCWALMAALFALGAMSIGWMLLISVLIAAEKLLPRRAITTVAVASVLGTLGVGVAAAPTHVPELTIPSSGKTMRAMGAMGAMGAASLSRGRTAPRAPAHRAGPA
jgi:predicted metal-binding membrane protein